MRRILLIVTTMMFVVAAAMAQPQRTPQRTQHGPHTMPQHHGPHAMMKMVRLTDEEVAAKFARMLRLDEEKAGDFTPVFETFLASKAEVDTQYPAQPRRMAQHTMHKEQSSETQMAEMKVQRQKMMAKHEATFSLHKEYRPQFLEVLNGRQYHRMMDMLRDPRMYVKFVRITPEADEEEETLSEQQVSPRSEGEGIASSIGAVHGNAQAGEWYSISGVRQNGQPTQTGIYVRDGKKVLLK